MNILNIPGDYQLNNGYSLTDMNGNCLDVTLDTPVENIVTLGQQRQRQAIFIIVYSVNRWCNMMGGRKSYKKYKKTYRKSKKIKKNQEDTEENKIIYLVNYYILQNI